jgi:hypothetical protein
MPLLTELVAFFVVKSINMRLLRSHEFYVHRLFRLLTFHYPAGTQTLVVKITTRRKCCLLRALWREHDRLW